MDEKLTPSPPQPEAPADDLGRPRSAGLLRFALITVPVILVLAGAGVVLYINQRDTLTRTYTAGARGANSILLTVSVQQVDLADNALVLRMTPDLPQSLLARDETPSKAITLEVSSDSTPEVHLPAGQTIRSSTINAPLGSGTVTDYPFDHYLVQLGFGAVRGTRQVPIRVKLSELDPFFLTKVKFRVAAGGLVLEEVRISRSRGTFILAWF